MAISRNRREQLAVCVLLFLNIQESKSKVGRAMALMIVEFVNPSAARAQEGRMILHYYVHLLNTGAQGRKYSVHARACACKQEDSGNRIKRAGRRPFEKDDKYLVEISRRPPFFPFILSSNRGNPSLQDRLVREYIYVVSIKVFFFSSAATLAPDVNQ